jgi:DNA-binding response OmpR family regulator
MRWVLHVENDPLVARAYARHLRQRGFQTRAVYSFRTGRQIEGTWDVVVMDIELGDGCGVDLGAELIERGVTQHVVFLTGSKDEALLARAQEIGAVVSKTAGFEALLEAVSGCDRPSPSSVSRTRSAVDPEQDEAPSGQRSA